MSPTHQVNESTSPPVNESTSPPVPILNACLSYVKFMMINRDRLYIFDATVARFDIPSIKVAHEMISKFCDPTLRYTYKGPNKCTPREKAVHAVEGIYKILVNLDAQGLNPTIACPSEELNKILVLNGPCDHKMLEDRFQLIESQISHIKSLESSMVDIKRTVAAIMTNSQTTSHSAGAAVPPVIIERLQSDINVNARTTDIQSGSKGRSFSVSSAKRGRSDDEDSDIDTEFLQPKYNLRKQEKRVKRSPDHKPLSKLSSSSSAFRSTPQRRKANWGKAVDTSSSGFIGAIPDLFVFNCAGQPDESVVKSYLESKNIEVVHVEMKSATDAYKRSFRVTVASHTDYDKLFAGEILPVGAGVKRFSHPRRKHTVNQWTSNSHVNIATANASDNVQSNTFQSRINEFYKVSESEHSALTSGNSGVRLSHQDASKLTAQLVSMSPSANDVSNINSAIEVIDSVTTNSV